jgi:D-alanyl-D-alanine carboxypeptidase (penicillin-binding protein 5/6)
LKVEAVYNGPIQTPINKNDVLGKLKLYYKDNLIGEYNLLASESVKRINIFSRLINSFNYLIWGDV